MTPQEFRTSQGSISNAYTHTHTQMYALTHTYIQTKRQFFEQDNIAKLPR